MSERESVDAPTVETPNSASYSVAARISSGMVGLTSRYMGRGPTKARTTLNANLAVVVLEDALTRGERTLVAAGEVESVQQQRRTFYKLMRNEAVAAVEEISSRRVRALMSDVDPTEGISTHVFIFAERAETGVTTVAEVDGAEGTVNS